MRYDPVKIEKKWRPKWQKEKTYEPDFARAKKPFYNLMMFPYPSAEGLHVGNMYAFTGADIYGRFKRMQGYDVFEPIGLDGFGIHSENYAIKIGKHPAVQAKISEKNFYRQLGMIGNGFAWRERLETYDPEYYKWTQWIFIQMYKRGLAYRKKASVNWCPSCKTVLADEQVIAGKCERCGTDVVKKDLEQWFFKITEYAERLLQNLEKIDWSERVKIAQRNWIGKSEGTVIKFKIRNMGTSDVQKLRNIRTSDVQEIEVFTTRPDTLFGATYVVLAPEHPLLADGKLPMTNGKEVNEYVKQAKSRREQERIAGGKEKTGVEVQGVRAVNPANSEEIPIWVADYVFGNVGTGAIMAVPAHDERDFEFAEAYDLPIRMVICPYYPAPLCPVLDRAYEGEGHLVDSGVFNGMPSGKARGKIAEFVKGKRTVQYRLRDWLISRQRYWGPPIPLIFCEHCAKSMSRSRTSREKSDFQKLSKGELENPGWIAVPEKDLPVKLPFVKNFRPTGTDQSPLASVGKFYKVRCPKCKSWARRETDVSDTFLDSAWYYLRYPSVREKQKPWNLAVTKKWLPVNMYIGGAEHSVLHLLYVRFLAMAFHDMGQAAFEEPFPKFRAHGLLIKDGVKMSKSKGNVVNPDEYIRAYGVDALRMYLMFLGPFEQGGDFRDTGVKGITRFLERVWKFSSKFKVRNLKTKSKIQKGELERLMHQTIKKVTDDIENLQYNTAISALMVLLHALENNPDAVSEESLSVFVRLLAPFAPHLTEELWQAMHASGARMFKSIHRAPWPVYDERAAREQVFELVVQVNGKVRGHVDVPVGITKEDALRFAQKSDTVKKYLEGKTPCTVIYVPNRLINIVL